METELTKIEADELLEEIAKKEAVIKACYPYQYMSEQKKDDRVGNSKIA